MSNVLTVVFDKAEVKLDSVIAAAVNELHNLGHVVKEVRVMGDTGEAKVALNTIEGILPVGVKDAVETAAKVVSDVANVVDPATTAPATTAPVADTAPADIPVDTPPTQTPAPVDTSAIDAKRLALLAQLDELDKEEEAGATGTADPTVLTTNATPGS